MALKTKAGTAGQAAALSQPLHCAQEPLMTTTTIAASIITPRVRSTESCLDHIESAMSVLCSRGPDEDILVGVLRIANSAGMESLDADPTMAQALLDDASHLLDVVRLVLAGTGDDAPRRALPLIDLARADLADAMACGSAA